MSNQFLYILEENLETHLDLLKSVPGPFSVRVITIEDYPATLASDISSSGDPMALRYTIVIAKETYFSNEAKYSIIGKTLQQGVLAEPVFIVASAQFTDEEMQEIVGHNDNICLIPMAEGGPENVRNAYLFGIVQKGINDFENNKKLVSQMRESFISFIQSEKHKEEKSEIARINDELVVENKIDTLTRIFNRKGILIEYEIAQSRTRREKRYVESGKYHDHIGHLSCMMIDIDDFKLINDSYGHLVGDLVLRKIAMILTDKSIFRLEDICGRYGGEEFLVIFPNTASHNARIPAERFRSHLAETHFYTEQAAEFHVTASIGIAELPYTVENPSDSMQDLADLEVLIHRADQAMYEAKRKGKNMVVLFDEIIG